MCFAVSPLAGFGISTGVSALSSIGGFLSGNSQADALEKHQRDLYEANLASAHTSMLGQFTQINRRILEEEEATFNELRNISTEARLARGDIITSAGESGVSGRAVSDLYDDFVRQELTSRQLQMRSQFFRNRQLQFEKEGIRAQYENRALAAIPQPVNRPGLSGLLGDLGSTALGGYFKFAHKDDDGNFTLG